LALDAAGKIDLAEAARGKLTLPVSRLSSGNAMEDREMQRRVDARRFPSIEGVLTGMEGKGEDHTYEVKGDISFKGVTRSYQDRMTVTPVDDDTIELSGQSRFDIREFGMEPPRILLLKVQPEVDVRVAIHAVKEA
jgi:polyisoprenoid-binding protein YceI